MQYKSVNTVGYTTAIMKFRGANNILFMGQSATSRKIEGELVHKAPYFFLDK